MSVKNLENLATLFLSKQITALINLTKRKISEEVLNLILMLF